MTPENANAMWLEIDDMKRNAAAIAAQDWDDEQFRNAIVADILEMCEIGEVFLERHGFGRVLS